MRFKVALVAGALAAALFGQAARADETVTVGGAQALLLKPRGAPVGSLILLAGGDGYLGIGPQGSFTRLEGNQLVRTRAAYAARGFAVLVPDHGVDLSAAVAFMAKIKRPVTVVGTSRGTQRAAEGLAQGAQPDALVLTSGFLSPQSGQGVHRSVIALMGSPARLPRTLVIHHRQDGCRFTLPSGVEPFVKWSGGKARVTWLDGGSSMGDPCKARAYHGFNGLDAQVVSAVAAFARP